MQRYLNCPSYSASDLRIYGGHANLDKRPIRRRHSIEQTCFFRKSVEKETVGKTLRGLKFSTLATSPFLKFGVIVAHFNKSKII